MYELIFGSSVVPQYAALRCNAIIYYNMKCISPTWFPLDKLICNSNARI